MLDCTGSPPAQGSASMLQGASKVPTKQQAGGEERERKVFLQRLFNAHWSPETQLRQQEGRCSRETHLVPCRDRTHAPPPAPLPESEPGETRHPEPPRGRRKCLPVSASSPTRPRLPGGSKSQVPRPPARHCWPRGRFPREVGGNLGLPRPEPRHQPGLPHPRAQRSGGAAWRAGRVPHGRAAPGWSSAAGPRSQAAARAGKGSREERRGRGGAGR